MIRKTLVTRVELNLLDIQAVVVFNASSQPSDLNHSEKNEVYSKNASTVFLAMRLPTISCKSSPRSDRLPSQHTRDLPLRRVLTLTLPPIQFSLRTHKTEPILLLVVGICHKFFSIK